MAARDRRRQWESNLVKSLHHLISLPMMVLFQILRKMEPESALCQFLRIDLIWQLKMILCHLYFTSVAEKGLVNAGMSATTKNLIS